LSYYLYWHEERFFSKIKARLKKLKVESQVKILCFVSPLELKTLYRLCRGVVFPSRFEGCGLPLEEAFQTGAPVASANVTCLPEQAGDAALLFDSEKTADIAGAIKALSTDDALCSVLIEKGRRKVASLSWEKTAKIYRAHYRRLANCILTGEDKDLLLEQSRWEF